MISFENISYSYVLSKKKKILTVILFQGTDIKYRSKLTLDEIYNQLPAFEDYTIKEIESELKNIGEQDITIERSEDKILFKYKMIILKKAKYLTFELFPSEKYVENEDDKEDYKYTEEEKDQMIEDLKKEIEAQNKEIADLENKIKEAEKMKSDLEIEVKSWEVSLNEKNNIELNKVKLSN